MQFKPSTTSPESTVVGLSLLTAVPQRVQTQAVLECTSLSLGPSSLFFDLLTAHDTERLGSYPF